MSTKQEVMPVRRWERNAILLQSIVFAGAVMGGVVAVLSHGAVVPRVPEAVAFRLGFFILSLLLLPVESVLQRRYYGRDRRVARRALVGRRGRRGRSARVLAVTPDSRARGGHWSAAVPAAGEAASSPPLMNAGGTPARRA